MDDSQPKKKDIVTPDAYIWKGTPLAEKMMVGVGITRGGRRRIYRRRERMRRVVPRLNIMEERRSLRREN